MYRTRKNRLYRLEKKIALEDRDSVYIYELLPNREVRQGNRIIDQEEFEKELSKLDKLGITAIIDDIPKE